MDFLIQVRWSNGPNQLLQRGDVNNGAEVNVTPDNGIPTLLQNGTASGADFLVKSPSSTVSVTVTFKPTIASHQAEVLSANQTYTVSGSDLTESSATVGPSGATTVTKHPLVTLTKQRSATRGTTAVFTVNVNTDFVDATELWAKMLEAKTTCMSEPLSCWGAYQKLHQSGTELVVMGFTAGSPVVWFVVVPEACKNASTISSLVFFRPALYAYSTFDDPKHAASGMFAMCRYLITARTKDPGTWWAWDRYHNLLTAQWAAVNNVPSQYYDWLCAGFEDALHKSGKSVILVCPLPVGTGFGVAQGANLSAHLASIRAVLYARGKIGVGQSTIQAGKLGLAGYSGGADGFFSCLQANRALVHELYMFDCNQDDQHVDKVAQWAFQTTDFKLRLVGGLDGHVRNNDLVSRTVALNIAMAGTKGQPPRTATGGEVSTHPAAPSTFYADASKGGDKWWNHVFAESPGFLLDPKYDGYNHGTRHQFAIYGGEDSGFAPGASAGNPWKGVSFLESFLSKSSL